VGSARASSPASSTRSRIALQAPQHEPGRPRECARGPPRRPPCHHCRGRPLHLSDDSGRQAGRTKLHRSKEGWDSNGILRARSTNEGAKKLASITFLVAEFHCGSASRLADGLVECDREHQTDRRSRYAKGREACCTWWDRPCLPDRQTDRPAGVPPGPKGGKSADRQTSRDASRAKGRESADRQTDGPAAASRAKGQEARRQRPQDVPLLVNVADGPARRVADGHRRQGDAVELGVRMLDVSKLLGTVGQQERPPPPPNIHTLSQSNRWTDTQTPHTYLVCHLVTMEFTGLKGIATLCAYQG
jgi:hypothetical protein